MQTVRTEFELTPILRLSLKKPTQLLQDKLQPTIQRSFWASNRHREEKSLLHVSMVAKFLDEQQTKTSLKKWIRTVSNFIDLI